ncbi:MAG: NAD(P)/FAD-dependent oxidoreductase [Alphaproteobacteria bacterium]|nr:NAD(P)/FAD-dependent oxidoreductase [Alphaproteobacteria bacterium]MBU1516371.1 NAD(P)/FAD-dependent oxidoreductase [Alphaproteobacteria bacterium]MBU2093392.1 NAD(P)/FAD-dependent oxidoreductase [Alphaproteobacteria bacterium]MBU2153879.1 NAD(P)/FAD-dependent oxidoreductase [Alphaproteobacteria bacterium]MBU2307751.1 NAD(P)/FAD-dependent oxidoreductase [Alphaproteobacteria bacterium]
MPASKTETGEFRDAIIIGAGVTGIYQLKRLLDLGLNAIVLEAAADLGGTWYNNRYPGARFDSESVSYGYSFSREVLDEWHWKERFSPQPENLRYLNFVADKFDLRRHMTFGFRVASTIFDDAEGLWTVTGEDGRELRCRYLVLALGLLSVPTQPRLEGLDRFKGQMFHTHAWPHQPVDLAGKRVAVIGTGATGIQVISAIANEVAELTVFQRRPNWAAPLGNGPISEAEMTDIRSRYDEIFEICDRSPGGFVHESPVEGFYDVTPEQRRAFWDSLYDAPGFGIWMGNYREIFTDDAANAELSTYIAERIRRRVNDPQVAEKLIPKDHGFGVQRVPLESKYYEVYNLPHVRLVDLSETPIQRVTETGVETAAEAFEFDIIVFATGFDAILGGFDRVDIRGAGGRRLRDDWRDGPSTYLGMLANGFPNLLIATGPQSASASANYPRGIELMVEWCTGLIQYAQEHNVRTFEATQEAQTDWSEHVKSMYSLVLMRKAKSWFTGYNSNIEGREHGKTRYLVYNGGQPRYRRRINRVADAGYAGVKFDPPIEDENARPAVKAPEASTAAK